MDREPDEYELARRARDGSREALSTEIERFGTLILAKLNQNGSAP